jgi:hypothetical protein
MQQKLHMQSDSGSSLTITVRGYENPAATNLDDANWLTCRVDVSAGGFSGSTDCALTTYDFERFGAGLDELVTADVSKTSFTTDEEHLRVELERRATGRIALSGVLFDPQSTTSLHFRWDSDFSQLKAMLRELERILAEFPVKESLDREDAEP